MLTVGVEDDPGHSALCMVCRLEVDVIYERFYIVAWEQDLPGRHPLAFVRKQGGLLRLCWAHADELSRLLLEVL